MAATDQGIQYVDDALVLSKVWCSACLYRGMQKVWPEDIGIAHEGDGPCLTYLHSSVLIQCTLDPIPVVVPRNVNMAFIMGHHIHSNLALRRIWGLRFFGGKDLCQYTWCQLCTYNMLIQGQIEHGVEPLIALVTECIQLGWPHWLV